MLTCITLKYGAKLWLLGTNIFGWFGGNGIIASVIISWMSALFSCTPSNVDKTNYEKMRLFKSFNLPYWTKLFKIKSNPLYRHSGEPRLISVYWVIFNYKAQRDLVKSIIEIKIYTKKSHAIATYNVYNLGWNDEENIFCVPLPQLFSQVRKLFS